MIYGYLSMLTTRKGACLTMRRRLHRLRHLHQYPGRKGKTERSVSLPRRINTASSGKIGSSREVKGGSRPSVSIRESSVAEWIQQTVISVRKVMHEVLTWCRILMPWILVPCLTLLMRPSRGHGYLTPNLSQHYSHVTFASASKSIADSKITWVDILQYKFQKVRTRGVF